MEAEGTTGKLNNGRNLKLGLSEHDVSVDYGVCSNTSQACLITLKGKVPVHAINACGEKEVWFHPFLALACNLPDWEEAPDTYCVGACVDPRAGLDVSEERKNPSPF